MPAGRQEEGKQPNPKTPCKIIMKKFIQSKLAAARCHAHFRKKTVFLEFIFRDHSGKFTLRNLIKQKYAHCGRLYESGYFLFAVE
jgi:hypothetical protein